MPAASEDRARLEAFIGKSEKAFGAGRVSFACDARAIKVNRFSSGVFGLDRILGGGWPFGRILLVHGPESSGKTTIVLKTAATITRYCRSCHRHQQSCKCEAFTPCRTLWVDQEGAFDEDWATGLGFNMADNLIARPDTAEESVDLITAALDECVVDLVVADSLEAFVPKAELESGSSNSQMGVKARLVNKALRRWEASIIRSGSVAPTVILINQEREKIGVMYGDPTTIPGGKGQLYACSIRLRLAKPEIKSVGGVDSAVSILKPVTKKNKVFVPNLESEVALVLTDHNGWEGGDFKNAVDIYKAGKDKGVTGHKFKVYTGTEHEEELSFRTDADAIDFIRDNPGVEWWLWGEVLTKCL